MLVILIEICIRFADILEVKMKEKTNCDCCMNYVYDEEFDYYVCEVYLDEDEMGRFLSNSYNNCPHFQFKDEYRIVRKQM